MYIFGQDIQLRIRWTRNTRGLPSDLWSREERRVFVQNERERKKTEIQFLCTNDNYTKVINHVILTQNKNNTMLQS